MIAIPFSITMLSDWHIGSGTGLAGVADATVRRDANGLPYQPGKTLTGIWRDACELVATALDTPSDGSPTGSFWCELLDIVFGSQPGLADGGLHHGVPRAPVGALASISSAHSPSAIARLLTSRRTLLDHCTIVVPGVRIGSNGSAQAEMYRQIELARAGARVNGTIEIATALAESPLLPHALALLWAGTQLAQRAGKMRRRGTGKLRLTLALDTPGLPVTSPNAARALLASTVLPVAERPKERDAIVVTTRAVDTDTSADEWRRYTLSLTATSPLVIEDRVQGNLVRTLDFVPGTLLIPAVLDAMRRAAGAGLDLHAALRRGDLLISDATPEARGARGLRVPRLLVHAKGEKGLSQGSANVLNRLADTIPELPLKAHRRGYIGPLATGTVPAFSTVDVEATNHAVIDDHVQRPTDNGLYGFEFIAPGTTLRAEIRLRARIADRLNETIWTDGLAAAPPRVGRAKKDEYGATSVTVQPIAYVGSQNMPTAATERSAFLDDVTHGRVLVLWCTSLLLARDVRLRWSAAPDDIARAILLRLRDESASVERTLTLRDEGKGPLTWTSVERRESWQTRWTLPRPTFAGAAAGSVLVFDVNGTPLTADECRALELMGVGERRAEGFGEVRVNDPRCLAAYASLTPGPPEQPAPADSPVPVSEPDPYVIAMFREAWRKEVRRCVERAADIRTADSGLSELRALMRSLHSVGSRSQLGVLRMLARAVTSDAGRRRAHEWLTGLATGANGGWSAETRRHLRALFSEPGVSRAPLWTTYLPIPPEIDPRGPHRDAIERSLWAESVRLLLIRSAKRAGRMATRTTSAPRPEEVLHGA